MKGLNWGKIDIQGTLSLLSISLVLLCCERTGRVEADIYDPRVVNSYPSSPLQAPTLPSSSTKSHHSPSLSLKSPTQTLPTRPKSLSRLSLQQLLQPRQEEARLGSSRQMISLSSDSTSRALLVGREVMLEAMRRREQRLVVRRGRVRLRRSTI